MAPAWSRRALDAAVATRRRARMDDTISTPTGCRIHLGCLPDRVRAAWAVPVDGPHRLLPGQPRCGSILRDPEKVELVSRRRYPPAPRRGPRSSPGSPGASDAGSTRPSATYPRSSGSSVTPPSTVTVHNIRITRVSGHRGSPLGPIVDQRGTRHYPASLLYGLFIGC
jgi:hypothetical protein